MDMYNWDMVCAMSCSRLNDRLKEFVREDLGTFSWSDEDGNEIAGEFGDWEIVPGGDAQRINIITPVLTGSLMLSNEDGGPAEKVIVDGLCPKLQVELAFVSAGSGSCNTHLRFSLAKMCQQEEVIPGQGAVVVLDADTTHLFRHPIMPAIFCGLMVEMLIARQEDIGFIFAELLALSGDNAWMTLHQLNYAYSEKISGELGNLAVLGILADNPSPPSPGKLQLVFDSALVRDGGSCGFMVSKESFMRNVVLPGLPEVFNGASADQFMLDADGIIRNNGAISLNEFHGYIPYFTSLCVEIVDNQIVFSNTSGRCDVVYDSYVTFDLSGSFTPSLIQDGSVYRIGINAATGPNFSVVKHDTAALAFWIFGGWVVDALLGGIESHMNTFMWHFKKYGMSFDIFPVRFCGSDYTTCGLAENFWIRD